MAAAHVHEVEVASWAWRRRAVLGAAAAALVCIAVFAAIPSAVSTGKARGVKLPADRALLVDILDETRRAWLPEAKVRARARAEAELPRIEAALRWLLAQPEHPLIHHAVELAGELRVASALDSLAHLQSDKGLRAPALLAADRIEPLTLDDIAGMLDPETPPDLLLAALTVAGRRDPRPVKALLPMLRHADPKVREAAAAALPDRFPDAAVSDLLDLCRDYDPAVAACALGLLGRAPIGEQVELFLTDALLQSTDEEAVRGALAALARSGRQLRPGTAVRIWEVAFRGGSRSLVAQALRTLELTKSYTAREVANRAGSFDAFGQYYCARLLIAAGDRAGIDLLFELLRTLPPDESAAELRFACRTLLGALTGTHAATPESEWREWFAARPLKGPRELPAPTF